MNKYTVIAVLAALLPVLATACNGTVTGNALEYRAEDLAYDTGDSYTERYVLDADDGTYERYIGGTYRGKTPITVRCSRPARMRKTARPGQSSFQARKGTTLRKNAS